MLDCNHWILRLPSIGVLACLGGPKVYFDGNQLLLLPAFQQKMQEPQTAACFALIGAHQCGVLIVDATTPTDEPH